MRVALPELDAPATLNLNREVSAEDFEEFCAANPSLRLELKANGEIAILPPVGGESSYRSVVVAAGLFSWARTDKRGKVFGSSAAFVLPSGAILAPDAAWVSCEKLQALTPAQRRRFLRLTPEFIVEVLSPSDRLADTENKMLEWIDNGVPLAWLINGDTRTVSIYRADLPPETRKGILCVSGEGPVAGFTLDLVDIWAGL